jgi:hypothetical protein
VAGRLLVFQGELDPVELGRKLEIAKPGTNCTAYLTEGPRCCSGNTPYSCSAIARLQSGQGHRPIGPNHCVAFFSLYKKIPGEYLEYLLSVKYFTIHLSSNILPFAVTVSAVHTHSNTEYFEGTRSKFKCSVNF